jgi:hypothetical protein
MVLSRLVATSLVGLGLLGLPGATTQAVGLADSTPCSLVTEVEASTVLGVSPGLVAHESITPNSCTWRSTDPNCFMRVLSVERNPVAKFGAEQWLAVDLPKGSQFSNDMYPPGSSLAIEYLDVPTSSSEWLHFALLGRVDRVTADQLLSTTAAASLVRL